MRINLRMQRKRIFLLITYFLLFFCSLFEKEHPKQPFKIISCLLFISFNAFGFVFTLPEHDMETNIGLVNPSLDSSR